MIAMGIKHADRIDERLRRRSDGPELTHPDLDAFFDEGAR